MEVVKWKCARTKGALLLSTVCVSLCTIPLFSSTVDSSLLLPAFRPQKGEILEDGGQKLSSLGDLRPAGNGAGTLFE